METERSEYHRLKKRLRTSWTTKPTFVYPPLKPLEFFEIRALFLKQLSLRTIETTMQGSQWSKRTAQFSLFSDSSEQHHRVFHREQSPFSYKEAAENSAVSFVLRDELSHYVDTRTFVQQIKLHRESEQLREGKPREAIIVTGGEYRLPFHLDGCETLLIAITGARQVSILLNFVDLYLTDPVPLHCQSYLPATYQCGATIRTLVLAEGEGMVIPPLIPHSVESMGAMSLAYTVFVDHPHVRETSDISELVR